MVFVIGGKKCPRPEDLVCTALLLPCGGVIKQQHILFNNNNEAGDSNGTSVWHIIIA